jgi:RNA polymerase sigma-70 factor (ECF subfamily)
MTMECIGHNDDELIRGMVSRDAEALEIFYDRYNRIAFTFVLRIVKSRADAEDVLMHVFWQVWQRAGRYDPARGKPLAWMLNIARARAIDCLRSHRRWNLKAEWEALQHPEVSEPWLNSCPLADVRRALEKCMDMLPHTQRVAFEMAFVEGMTQTEIAQALKQPLGTIKTRIRAATLRLRQSLKAYDPASTSIGRVGRNIARGGFTGEQC